MGYFRSGGMGSQLSGLQVVGVDTVDVSPLEVVTVAHPVAQRLTKWLVPMVTLDYI